MILLDIDDTLIDHSGAEQTAANLFGAQFSATIPDYEDSKFVSRWHDVAELHIADFLSGEISFQEQRRRRLRDIFIDSGMTDDKADELFQIYLTHYENAWRLFPDVIPFLEANKDIGFGIVSDGSHVQQLDKLKSQGIDGYMRFVVTAEKTGFCKPDPRMFYQACEMAAIAPGSAWYIGDNLRKDTIGAESAGLKGIWLNRTGMPVPAGINSIASLSDFRPNQSLEVTQLAGASSAPQLKRSLNEIFIMHCHGSMPGWVF